MAHLKEGFAVGSALLILLFLTGSLVYAYKKASLYHLLSYDIAYAEKRRYSMQSLVRYGTHWVQAHIKLLENHPSGIIAEWDSWDDSGHRAVLIWNQEHRLFTAQLWHATTCIAEETVHA